MINSHSNMKFTKFPLLYDLEGAAKYANHDLDSILIQNLFLIKHSWASGFWYSCVIFVVFAFLKIRQKIYFAELRICHWISDEAATDFEELAFRFTWDAHLTTMLLINWINKSFVGNELPSHLWNLPNKIYCGSLEHQTMIVIYFVLMSSSA